MKTYALTTTVYLKKKKNNITNSPMSIQEEMFKAIEAEIDKTVEAGKEKVIVNNDKAKKVARMLTELSVNKSDADSLVNDYISRIKNICKS